MSQDTEFKIMRAWDKGNSRIAYLYRDEVTKRKKIGEVKFDWWFYINTKDYEDYESQFKVMVANNQLIKCEPEGRYTRLYMERPHRGEFLNKEMERIWEYKNFGYNRVME